MMSILWMGIASSCGRTQPDSSVQSDHSTSPPIYTQARNLIPSYAGTSPRTYATFSDAAPELDPLPWKPADLAYTEVDYPLGVQAGEISSDTAHLWTYTTLAASHTLWVWLYDSAQHDRAFAVRHGQGNLKPDSAGILRAKIVGLKPATVYRYMFTPSTQSVSHASVPTKRSRMGRFRTALSSSGSSGLRLFATACTNIARAPFSSLSLAAQVEPDLFLHLGDMSYNDDAETLDEYRQLWRQTLLDQHLQTAFASAGMYATWDDHEVFNDWNPEKIEPERREVAIQAFYEHVAIRPVENDRLWRSFRWGNTAEFFVLDGRSERMPSSKKTASEQYLSDAQLAWLLRGLRTSPSRFKIILNSSPITEMPDIWLGAEHRWPGYAQQRHKLLAFIEEQAIDGVVFLTGDYHVSFVSRIAMQGPGSRIWEIAVGPGGSKVNGLVGLQQLGVYAREDIFPTTQFAFSSGRTHLATVLDLDPATHQLRAIITRADGSVIHDRYYSTDL